MVFFSLVGQRIIETLSPSVDTDKFYQLYWKAIRDSLFFCSSTLGKSKSIHR